MIVGVWGAGKEGQSAAAHFAGEADRVVVVEEKDIARPEVLDARAEYVSGANALEHLTACDLVVCSPGVPRTHPFRSRLDESRITSLTSVWMQQAGTSTIGVTGTKGKSTTATLIAELIKAAGVEVQLGGNIGVPLVDLREGLTATVAELSSYQCASLTRAPRVAVLTSLFEDHLPWHGSKEQYWRDKARIFGDGCEVLVCTAETRATISAAELAVPENVVVLEQETLDRLNEVALPSSLRAPHNRTNLALGVLAVQWRLGRLLTSAEIADAVAAFEPLSHRLETIAVRNGVAWIDDTLSTIPQSVVAAVSGIDGAIVLIVGGQDRGVDYGPLDNFLATRQPLVDVITIPTNGARIAQGYERQHPARVHAASDLADAVSMAADLAVPGSSVLLSPGAPSHDHFRNYEHKAEVFAECVRALDTKSD